MSIIRLTSGADVPIRYSVNEALEILSALTQPTGFIELPGMDGSLFVRPAEVIAIFPEPLKRGAGFHLEDEDAPKSGKKS